MGWWVCSNYLIFGGGREVGFQFPEIFCDIFRFLSEIHVLPLALPLGHFNFGGYEGSEDVKK